MLAVRATAVTEMDLTVTLVTGGGATLASVMTATERRHLRSSGRKNEPSIQTLVSSWLKDRLASQSVGHLTFVRLL